MSKISIATAILLFISIFACTKSKITKYTFMGTYNCTDYRNIYSLTMYSDSFSRTTGIKPHATINFAKCLSQRNGKWMYKNNMIILEYTHDQKADAPLHPLDENLRRSTACA
jgi:hypothetical protein